MTRFGADLLLLLCALIWGVAFLLQKSALEHVGPMTFVMGRSLIACLVLGPLAWVAHRRVPMAAQDVRETLRIGVIGGVLFFLGAVFQQVGLVTATVSNTGFLTGLYVVFTPLLGWAIWRKAPNTIIWPAAGLAFVGTFLLGGGSFAAFGTGDWLVAIGAIFWAAHVLATGAAARLSNAALFTSVQFAVVGLLALLAALATETITVARLVAGWREFLYVGLLSSALTFTLLTIAMKHTPAAEASIIVSLEMVVAAVAAHIFLGERLGATGLAGAVLMLAACVLIQAEPLFRRSKTAT